MGGLVASPYASSLQVGGVGDRLSRCHAAAADVRRRCRRSSWRWALMRWMRALMWGLLMLVDPSGRDPFGEPVGVDAAGPAFLQEVGVVVSAEQGQIVKIS